MLFATCNATSCLMSTIYTASNVPCGVGGVGGEAVHKITRYKQYSFYTTSVVHRSGEQDGES